MLASQTFVRMTCSRIFLLWLSQDPKFWFARNFALRARRVGGFPGASRREDEVHARMIHELQERSRMIHRRTAPTRLTPAASSERHLLRRYRQLSTLDPSSMEKILERYQRHSFEERSVNDGNLESPETWSDEFSILKYKLESLQKSQSHLMGEQLDPLTVKELQHLEQQLETSLRHIRSRKTKLLFDSISDLQKKERSLVEENTVLKKMTEKKKPSAPAAIEPSQEAPAAQLRDQQLQPISIPSPRLVLAPSLPTPNIGSLQLGNGAPLAPQAAVAEAPFGHQHQQQLPRACSSNLPAWMLRPVAGR